MHGPIPNRAHTVMTAPAKRWLGRVAAVLTLLLGLAPAAWSVTARVCLPASAYGGIVGCAFAHAATPVECRAHCSHAAQPAQSASWTDAVDEPPAAMPGLPASRPSAETPKLGRTAPPGLGPPIRHRFLNLRF